jgi:hypothetical protein
MNKLELLLNVSSELAQERDLKKILGKLTNIAKKLLNADICSIFLHDKKNRQLWTIVAEKVDEIRIPDNKGIAGQVFHSGELLHILDAYQDPRFDQETDKKIGYHTKNMLALPLINNTGSAFGVLEIINKLDDTSFGHEDIDLLKHITSYAASIIDNFFLNDEIKQAHKDLVHKLSSVTKFKDKETQNHIIRVGLYCGVLAKEYQWTETRIELIQLASPMHDIGKVGIPDHILLKQGKLESEERAIIEKHSQYGYEILKGADSELLQLAASIAIQHHEKWDGSGYPAGLSGDNIIIEARMTALADVFDALTSERPYKNAWTFEKTLEYIASEKGKQFDPVLVDFFIANAQKMIKIKTDFKDE